jgi:hypothetical protein
VKTAFGFFHNGPASCYLANGLFQKWLAWMR